MPQFIWAPLYQSRRPPRRVPTLSPPQCLRIRPVAARPPSGPEGSPLPSQPRRTGQGARLRSLLANPLVRQNLLYLVGIGGSGAGVLVAQSYGAHHLSAAANGESTSVVAVLNLLYTTSYVVAAGAAREVAATVARGIPAAERWPDLRRTTWRIGLGLAAAMVPVSVLLGILLHLPHPEVLAATLLAGPLSAFAGAQRGYLQGVRDFRRLAFNFLLYGGTTVVLSVLLLHLGLGSAAIPLATVCGALASAVYPRHPKVDRLFGNSAPGRLVDQTVLAGAATAPLFNNLDVVAARHVLPASQAGLYSGLSVMGKIIFFGTSSLSAVMYPRIAAAPTASARRRLLVQTLLALAVVDAVLVLGYWLLARHLLHTILGRTYVSDSHLLLLFALGVVGLTLVNLLVYYGMGVRQRRSALVPALGVPALVAWLFTSPPALDDFVPRIAGALLILAALEAALVLPGALRRERRDN